MGNFNVQIPRPLLRLTRARLRGFFVLLTLLSPLIYLTFLSKENYSTTIARLLPISSNSVSSITSDLRVSLSKSDAHCKSENDRPSSSTTFSSEKFDAMAHLYQQTRVNCAALFSGHTESIQRAVQIAKILATDEEKERLYTQTHSKQRKELKQAPKTKSPLQQEVRKWSSEFEDLTNQWYIRAAKDCETFKQKRGYITSSLTQDEEELPIAFSLLVFKDVEMVERLLRSVYRPQNRYCIHVDVKSDREIYNAVSSIAACFPDNVRMSSRRVDVRWGKFTVLEPELVCMQDLWDMDTAKCVNDDKEGEIRDNPEQSAKHAERKKWRYFINLTGQEFPLKTNYELVQILKAFKGANNEGVATNRAANIRWKTRPPHGITPYKGAVHTVLNRATVDYILHNKTAKDLITWLKTTEVPDETLFSTLNFNPQLNIPGAYKGKHLGKVKSLARHKKWWGWNCYSNRTVRGVCILSTGDLPSMGRSEQLFANKFYLRQDRVVIGCLEEKQFNNTRDEFLGKKTFNATFYEQQEFVINQIPTG